MKYPGISLLGRYGYPHASISVKCGWIFGVGLGEWWGISSIGEGVVTVSSWGGVVALFLGASGCIGGWGSGVFLVLVVAISGVGSDVIFGVVVGEGSGGF